MSQAENREKRQTRERECRRSRLSRGSRFPFRKPRLGVGLPPESGCQGLRSEVPESLAQSHLAGRLAIVPEMHDGVFVDHFVGSLCRPGRSNAALFDKVFDEVSDKVFPEHPPGTGSK